MKFYKVCEDDFGEEYCKLPNGVKWVAYDYTNEGYEGSGSALVAWEDGTFHFEDMSHCSCYSPLENVATQNRAKHSLKDIESWFGLDDNKKTPSEYEGKHYAGMWEAVKLALKENPIV